MLVCVGIGIGYKSLVYSQVKVLCTAYASKLFNAEYFILLQTGLSE